MADPVRPARLLVLRGGAVGDFIVTLPALHALRQRWPDAHLEVIGYPHVARLATWFSLANRVRSLDEARIARYFAENARIHDEDQAYFASFDAVINYLHDPQQILAGNLKRCGVKVHLPASPLVTSTHAVDHFLAPLASLAIYPDDLATPLTVPAHHRRTAAKPWIALHPGSGGTKKCWPLAQYLALAQRLAAETPLTPVFITGDAEREHHPDLDHALAGFTRLHHPPLDELAAELTSASAYLGNDAGITHLAATVGTPTLALFGPTNPALWAPRGPRVHVLTAPGGDLNRLAGESVWSALVTLLPPPHRKQL